MDLLARRHSSGAVNVAFNESMASNERGVCVCVCLDGRQRREVKEKRTDRGGRVRRYKEEGRRFKGLVNY